MELPVFIMHNAVQQDARENMLSTFEPEKILFDAIKSAPAFGIP
jgi:hypothetical protein